MRALVLAGLALLLLAPAALAEPSERVSVRVPHPLPGFGVMLYEDPDCFTHQLLWEGAWMSGMDVVSFVWYSWAGLPAPHLEHAYDRLTASAALASARATSAAETFDPDHWGEWAAAQLGNEDVCVLELAGLTTGQ